MQYQRRTGVGEEDKRRIDGRRTTKIVERANLQLIVRAQVQCVDRVQVSVRITGRRY